tara:strand:- start:39 stop:554 length:516 start_codon:yes stop_codon:yes gene_type:complete
VEKKRHYAIWITGLPGSGKTNIGKYFHKKFEKKYGPTLFFNGDDIRRIFKIKSYDIKSRRKLSFKYSKFVSFISKQKVNIIFTCVAMFDDVRKYNKKHIKNYKEIYISSNLKKIISEKKKKLYLKTKKNMVGIDIKAELPKKPDISIKNNFKKSVKELASELFSKFNKQID